MANHAQPRIGCQDTLQSRRSLAGTVSDDHLSGVLAIANSHTAPVVERDPRSATHCVDQGVQDSPIADRIRAVQHPLGLSIGRRHRSGIQVIAPDDDGRLNHTFSHQVVERQAGIHAFAITQPADPRRQPLERHLFSSQFQPAVQMLILREQLHDRFVRGVDIFRIAGERHPAEGAFSLTKQRPDIGRYEARIIEGLFHALIVSPLA